MGVPKFYRWISERYPCLSQVVKEHQIPEFDNLYLDMNGIIHPCSHPNDDDPHFRITEADIFQNIFHYIEVLFRIIRPNRVFYMAVDGVAPRAKMNQQRSRRFRTAKEAEDNIRRAVEKGQVLPKEERFDSNCITPGTEFMARLHEQLKYFVNMKISSDPLWQKCTVYLSGHNVPGEGEHKIMDYIRYEKSKEDYDPNTRHCLYGLDADLIILGLTSHEPHFSLLREEVRFGKQAKRLTKPEEQTFHLLHLSLMREYLDFEFGSLKDKLPFQYELERIIDDWVVLGFLVGNDFIPHLPHMHINHDALPYLYEIYIEVMPTLDGYLNDGGSLNLNRFEKYLKSVSKFDKRKFEDVYSDMKWLQGKLDQSQGSERNLGNSSKKMKFSEMVSQLDDDEIDRLSNRSQNNYLALADISDAFDDSFAASPSPKKKPSQRKDDLSELLKSARLEDEDGDTFELEFKQNKRSYYMEKFHLTLVPDEWVRNLAIEYVRAIQWILHYYFNGVQSWSWYYPFHYAPYVSDITEVSIYRLKYEKAKPFKPFEQLLAVLPAASRKLLPQPFQSLMIMDNSPIIDFYPVEFNADLNGKQQDWEAVVLIPFIDEDRLLSAMARHYSYLKDEEKERNSYGNCLKSNYSSNVSFKYPSSLPGILKDIEVCKASCEELHRDFFRLEIREIKKGLCEGVKQSVYFPGFPTFKHIPHNAELKKAGVRVFQQNSKNRNMIINVNDIEQLDITQVKDLVGQTVYVEWPYLVEAFVISVSNQEKRYSWKEKENRIEEMLLNENKSADVIKWLKHVKTQHLERRGIDLGPISILVEAKPLVGKRYVCGTKGGITLEKEWTGFGNLYSHQVVLKNLSVYASLYEKVCESVEELFPVGSECFMMASPHYGCSGEVLEIDKEAGRVRVALKVPNEPQLDGIIMRQHELSIQYLPSHLTAQKLGISSNILSRVTGNILIQKKKNPTEVVNIGLKLKFSKGNKEILGYARRTGNGAWSFSPATIDALSSYIQRFPFVFDALSKTDGSDRYKEEDIFHDAEESSDVLQEVKDFLKSLPFYNVQPVECGSNTLDKPVMEAIEKAVEEAKSNKNMQKTVKVKVKPYVLFRSTAEFGNLVPDPSADYHLFDRVVNVRDGAAVPLAIRGTVVGIHEVKNEEKEEAPKDVTYEVIFDEAFLGGLKLRVSEDKGYYMTPSSLLNLSYGERKEANKKGRSPASFSVTPGRTPPQNAGNSYRTPPFHGANSHRISASNSHGIVGQSAHGRPPKASTPFNGSGRGNQVGAVPTLISPDFWLGGYGGGYSPHEQANQRRSRTMSDDTRSHSISKSHVESNTTPTKDGGNTEFLAMWKELQKSEQKQQQQFGMKPLHSQLMHPQQMSQTNCQPGAQQFSPRKNEMPNVTSPGVINKEGTALLHQLLNINTALSPPEAFVLRGSTPQNLTSTSRPQFTPIRQAATVPVTLNQMFQQPPRSPQTPPFQPASPTSPIVLGMPPSTALLQNWCVTNKMPMPNYTYSVTSQGIHAVVAIGPAICFGGMMCSNRQQAAESAAAIAFGQLPHLPHFSAASFGTIPMQVPRHHSSPLQQTRSPTSNRQPYTTHQQQQNRNSEPYIGQRLIEQQSNSTSADQFGFAKEQPVKARVAKNLFVPHQVEVKGSSIRTNSPCDEENKKKNTGRKPLLDLPAGSVDQQEAFKKLSGTGDQYHDLSNFEVLAATSNAENKLHDTIHVNNVPHPFIQTKAGPRSEDIFESQLAQTTGPVTERQTEYTTKTELSFESERIDVKKKNGEKTQPRESKTEAGTNANAKKASNKRQILLAPTFFGSKK